jgi:DNA segregation ATPase FtsK/SpoIIIE, S-DNA-T family
VTDLISPDDVKPALKVERRRRASPGTRPPSKPHFGDTLLGIVLREGVLLAWVAVTIGLSLALLSYDPFDPGWSSTGSHRGVANVAGPVGAWIADVFFSLWGYGAFVIPLLLAQQAWRLFRERQLQQPRWGLLGLRALGLLLLLTAGTGLLVQFHGSLESDLPFSAGGLLGVFIATGLDAAFGVVGASLLLLLLCLFGLTLLMDISWFRVMDGLGYWTIHLASLAQTATVRWLRQRQLAQPKHTQPKRSPVLHDRFMAQESPTFAAQTAPSNRLIAPTSPLEADANSQAKPSSKPVKIAIQMPKPVAKPEQARLFDAASAPGDLPAVSLLEAATKSDRKGYSPESLEAMSRLLELKLKDFGVVAEVVAVMPGPVVTRFELQPAPGVKASKFTSLARDIARSLAVISVRVVEVIEGKSVIGIEIPNQAREMVRLSEVIASEVYEKSRSPLTLALGHDISGQPIIADLAKMPHLLVAGTTGSGKSVGVNAMLVSILFKATPEDVRLLLVDPKMLELSVYEGIPHLLAPVITDMKDAATGLRWCVGEMERRYKLMAALGVRNLAGYNKKILDAEKAGSPLPDPLWRPDEGGIGETEAPSLGRLPFIVVVIDEFADMMMIVGKKVEQLIARIAQKARAAGIHMILATQRPSVDVITGLIKANIPTRMAFQVSSKIDSRTILDQGGAEQLLGHGDMLYLPPGTSLSMRVHGAFLDDHEVHAVVADWKARGAPQYLDAIFSEATDAVPIPGFSDDSEAGGSSSESDPLYDEALAFVTESRKASISAVQRKLRIGYNRAARLIEDMEAAGVVTAPGHNGNREVIAPPPPAR